MELELRIFPAASSRFFDWILLGVERELVSGSRKEIHIESVGEADEIQQNVRHFLADPCDLVG